MKTINLQNILSWSGWILLFIVLFFMKQCSPQPTLAKIEIPEKKGSFEGKKPTHYQLPDFGKPIIEYRDGVNVVIENPLNEVLLSENEILKDEFKIVDSINKILLYEKAIAINAFSTKFEDENLKLNIDGLVRGEVQEITPSYTIKKQTVLVPNKETIFRLLGGVEVGNTIQLNELTFKANVGFQNKSGDVLNFGYDNQNVIWVGFSKNIFKVER